MAYIYKITNKINGKIYIGQTSGSIEDRWRAHLADRNRRSYEKRPLYSAINKYGPENFIIEEIEECSIDEMSDREIYWIEYYGSFKNGYNATKGGDGKPFLDRELIIKTYNEVHSIQKVSEILKHDYGQISKILHDNNVEIRDSMQVNRELYSKTIAQCDKETNEIIQVFPSIHAAASAIGKSKGCSHLTDAANGKRKSAYGYKWKFI